MNEYTVEIYAVEWCGFGEYYEVRAESEDFAEEVAIEQHLEDFVQMFDLILVENGEYIEVGDDEDDEDVRSSISARVIS